MILSRPSLRRAVRRSCDRRRFDCSLSRACPGGQGVGFFFMNSKIYNSEQNFKLQGGVSLLARIAVVVSACGPSYFADTPVKLTAYIATAQDE